MYNISTPDYYEQISVVNDTVFQVGQIFIYKPGLMRIMHGLIEKPFKLSKEQTEPVISENNYVKVLAGAGAGKTEVLARRILYLLLEKSIEPESIVAFTFTEKAASEMKNRIMKEIVEIAPDYNGAMLGKMYIGTIHSFAFRLLQDKFDYGMYRVIDQNQEMAYIIHNGYALGLSKEAGHNYSDKCSRFQHTLDIVYDEDIPVDKILGTNPHFVTMLDRYEKSQDTDRVLSFSRLIYLAVHKISENPDKIEYIKHLLVDEYQDINRIQYELIKLMGKSAGIFVVGDPRQSIYEWRGSNHEYFDNFENDFPGTASFVLSKNRRSLKNIVNLSNNISASFQNGPEYPDMESTRNGNGYAVQMEFADPGEEARKIADIIKNSVDKNGKKYSDFSILFRSVNGSGNVIIEEFKKRRIPFLVSGSSGLFKRGEVLALAKTICWLAQDGFFGFGQTQLMNDKLIDSAVDDWKKTVQSVKNIKSKLGGIRSNIDQYKDYKELYTDILIAYDYNELNPEDDLDAAIMANIGRFTKILGDFEKSVRYRGGNKNMEKEMKNLCWFINTYASNAYDEAQVDDFSGQNVVTVSTVHQAKGLEWPVVFVPSMQVSKFPVSNGHSRDLYIDSSLYPSERYRTSIESEMRLFYVSVTRARDYCIMSSYKENGNGRRSSKSKFLDLCNDYTTYKELDLDFENGGEREEFTTIPVTSLVEYLRCPYHYRLSHDWGYTQGVSPFMGYGEALHYVLRKLSEDIMHGIPIDYKYIKKVVDHEFYLPFASREFINDISRSINENIYTIFNNFLKNAAINQVESRIEFPLENTVVPGKIDIIIGRDNKVEVRDYKTSEDVVTEEESRMQILLYSQALKNMGYDVSACSIINIKEGESKEVPVSNEIITKNTEMAVKMIRSIRGGKYQGKRSNFCLKCEYNKICTYCKV